MIDFGNTGLCGRPLASLLLGCFLMRAFERHCGLSTYYTLHGRKEGCKRRAYVLAVEMGFVCYPVRRMMVGGDPEAVLWLWPTYSTYITAASTDRPPYTMHMYGAVASFERPMLAA